MARRSILIGGVATTLTLGLFLTGYYTTYLAWEDLKPWRTYHATFTRTIGLAKDDPVFVSGYQIGRVHRISLQGDHQLVELQVDPAVRFFKDGLKVIIQPTDSFGDVGVYVNPGDAKSGFWDPDVEVKGEFFESLAGGSGTDTASGGGALSATLKDLEAFTEALTRADGGAGRLLNDPDSALAVKEGFENAHATTTAIRSSLTDFESGEGLGALTVRDAAVPFDEAFAGTTAGIRATHEALIAANHGEGGLTGRLVGDPDAATSVKDGFAFAGAVFQGYEHGEGVGTSFLTRGDEPADRILGSLDELARWTGEASRGEGGVGGLFGPATGTTARDSLAAFASRLESMTAGDPSTGELFSRSLEGRRAMDDLVSRIDDVLRDMRRALARIRVDQAPNTFPGALLSVF